MDPAEYRIRARRCRVAAAGSEGALRRDFLDAAEAWDLLADQLERLEIATGRVVTPDAGRDPAAPENT
jgi:hypothetical protein